MPLLQKFLNARIWSQCDAAPELYPEVSSRKHVTAVVVRWTCNCTVLWARSTETVEAVCSLCGNQFERDRI